MARNVNLAIYVPRIYATFRARRINCVCMVSEMRDSSVITGIYLSIIYYLYKIRIDIV